MREYRLGLAKRSIRAICLYLFGLAYYGSSFSRHQNLFSLFYEIFVDAESCLLLLNTT